ncbi:G-type lectin S-receptor-like serine/threonine-protein kinase At1g61400 [Durusdinium trenchii]|uniref:G-type lectin S-receptor-like serine/threonine-protein kinase At1g61400 n=1 Tax=Durusdinium trenchii TaxID=1381693 RepID=A0ABP0IS59_9DINO
MATALNQLSLEYSCAELLQATNNFSENNRLGYGTFGGVFRGVQRDGTEIAVKVLEGPEEAGFEAPCREEEVRVLSKFRHPNLVILMGFAKNGPQRLLVYEHLGGGDVFRRLQRCAVDNVPFTWRERISAAFDASCGLSHLHNSTPKVFHRDIKCPNILLDRNGTAKMADFGLACCSHAKEQKVEQAAGTVGYACPHYVNKGVVSEGSEVYSFGIVLLELLTALQPAQLSQGPDGKEQYHFLVTHLASEVRLAVQNADQKAHWPHEVAASFGQLGLNCTEYQEENRPCFTEVVTALRSLRDIEVPSPPPLETPPPRPPSADASPISPPVHPPGPHVQQAVGHGGGLPQGIRQPVPQQMFVHQHVQHVQHAQQHVQQQHVQQQHVQHVAVQQVPSPQWQSAAYAQRIAPAAYGVCGASLGQTFDQCLEQRNPQRPSQLEPERFSGACKAPQPLRISIYKPLLWTLECVMSQCGKLLMLSKEQKMLLHKKEGGALPTMRFGRLFQDDFCRLVLPDDHFFSQVSREHFQIWAQEWPPLGHLQLTGEPCSFRLTNYGTVGTAVDGMILDARGQQAVLHHGSTIGLLGRVIVNGIEEKVPFLEFRFSLEGSILADADAAYASLLQRSVEIDCFDEGQCGHDRHDDGDDFEGFGVPVPGGISFVGDDVEPVFILEVGGTAVRAGARGDQRHVLHGPRASACAAAPGCEAPCPPLVLGSFQAGFWRRILNDKASHLLDPQHLVIEVDDEASERRFFLRNLSKLQLRVEGAPEEGQDSTRREEGGKWQLHHGDTILLNLSKGNSMWMIFREIMIRID